MPALDIKVDPTIADEAFDLVFSDKFFWDVGDLDADLLWLVHGVVEIEVLEIHGGHASIALREYTVDEEFDKFE